MITFFVLAQSWTTESLTDKNTPMANGSLASMPNEKVLGMTIPLQTIADSDNFTLVTLPCVID